MEYARFAGGGLRKTEDFETQDTRKEGESLFCTYIFRRGLAGSYALCLSSHGLKSPGGGAVKWSFFPETG
jgi:hypothetical protein